jgi:hypothetical protein
VERSLSVEKRFLSPFPAASEWRFVVRVGFPDDLLKALSRPLDVDCEAFSSLFVIKQGTF